MGSENVPVLKEAASATSHFVLSSQMRGFRIGKWSLNSSRLGSVTNGTRSSRTG